MFDPQFCIDWLTLTFPAGSIDDQAESSSDSGPGDLKLLTARAKSLLRYVLGLDSTATFCPSYPHYGMRLALASENAAAIHFCPSTRSGLDCVIVVPGSALVTVRTLQQSTRYLATRAMQRGARCSRLDLAIDIFQGDIETYIDDAKAHITGDVRRRATILRPLDDANGTTLYIGSRKSSRFLRVYQKDRQLGVDIGCPWIRVELEAKRKVARAMFRKYAKSGLSPLVADIVSRYTFSNDVWHNLLLYAAQGTEARRILVESTQGKADKSEWVLRHISAIAKGIDEMTWTVFMNALATRAASDNLLGLMSDIQENA